MVCRLIPYFGSMQPARSQRRMSWATIVTFAMALAATPAQAQGAMSLMAADDVDPQDTRLVASYFEVDAEKLGFAPAGKPGEGEDLNAAAAALAQRRQIDIIGARLASGDGALTVDVVVVGIDGSILGAASAVLEAADDRKTLRKALARAVQAYRKRGPSTPAPTVAPVVEPPPPPPTTEPVPDTSATPTAPETAPLQAASSDSGASEERPAAGTSDATLEGDNPWVTPLAVLGSAVGLAGAALGCGILAQANVDAIREGRAENVASARLGALAGATAADAMTTGAVGLGVIGIVSALMTMAGSGDEAAGLPAAPL